MISRFVKSGQAVIAVLFALVVGIVFLIWVLVIMESLGLHSQMTEHQCVNNDWEKEHIRQLALDGIDDALKKHTTNLFDIWVKDPAEQPRRAVTGMHISLSAYNRARNQVLKWDPPPCLQTGTKEKPQ